MVYRKRNFTEVHGAILLEATEKFGHVLREAESNAPFESEIFTAIEKLWDSVRHLQITLTGDPEYGRARAHSTHNNLPPKPLTLRTWKTVPLWKKQEQKG
jgi:hypothetical protein